MRVLITGAGGFVGPYVAEALRLREIETVLTGLRATTMASGQELFALDVTDAAAVRSAVDRWSPTHIIHLAGIASPADANIKASASWRVHLEGTLNVANSILEQAPNCVLMYAGSALVYGMSAKPGLPLDEQSTLAPRDIYAASEAAADLALGALAHQGLRGIRLRLFNHTGPGQSSKFAIPNFAMQIARIEAQRIPPVVYVRNVDVERDFLDVRDVASAYALVVQRSDQIKSGTIMNISSGKATRLRAILDELIDISRLNVRVVENSGSSTEPPQSLLGNPTFARDLLGWKPRYPMRDTLRDVLNFWRASVVRE
jgi:GDP-4-dehydro-6-deoxy-D-mannose reductase